jgi:hypothetical protein
VPASFDSEMLAKGVAEGQVEALKLEGPSRTRNATTLPELAAQVSLYELEWDQKIFVFTRGYMVVSAHGLETKTAIVSRGDEPR